MSGTPTEASKAIFKEHGRTPPEGGWRQRRVPNWTPGAYEAEALEPFMRWCGLDDLEQFGHVVGLGKDLASALFEGFRTQSNGSAEIPVSRTCREIRRVLRVARESSVINWDWNPDSGIVGRTRIGFAVPIELDRALRHAAVDAGTSLSELGERLLSDGLKKLAKPAAEAK